MDIKRQLLAALGARRVYLNKGKTRNEGERNIKRDGHWSSTMSAVQVTFACACTLRLRKLQTGNMQHKI